MKIDISGELEFRTARSGGKGGQNVNKVETMVEGLFNIDRSNLLSNEQKQLVKVKFQNQINSEGFLTARSSATRSQLSNKQIVIDKLNTLVNHALEKKKARISTKPTKSSKEARLKFKKHRSEIKSLRGKIDS